MRDLLYDYAEPLCHTGGKEKGPVKNDRALQ
jgi:hypothetical protein